MFNLLTGITINKKPEPSSAARWIEEKLETLHSFNPVLWIPTFPPPQKEKYGENITKLINFNHSKTKVKEMFSFFVTILDEAITYYVWKVLFFFNLPVCTSLHIGWRGNCNQIDDSVGYLLGYSLQLQRNAEDTVNSNALLKFFSTVKYLF